MPQNRKARPLSLKMECCHLKIEKRPLSLKIEGTLTLVNYISYYIIKLHKQKTVLFYIIDKFYTSALRAGSHMAISITAFWIGLGICENVNKLQFVDICNFAL